jgi:hypothetical protein
MLFFRRKPPADRLSNHQLVERFKGEVRDALDAAGRAGMGPRSPMRDRTRLARCDATLSDAASDGRLKGLGRLLTPHGLVLPWRLLLRDELAIHMVTLRPYWAARRLGRQL